MYTESNDFLGYTEGLFSAKKLDKEELLLTSYGDLSDKLNIFLVKLANLKKIIASLTTASDYPNDSIKKLQKNVDDATTENKDRAKKQLQQRMDVEILKDDQEKLYTLIKMLEAYIERIKCTNLNLFDYKIKRKKMKPADMEILEAHVIMMQKMHDLLKEPEDCYELIIVDDFTSVTKEKDKLYIKKNGDNLEYTTVDMTTFETIKPTEFHSKMLPDLNNLESAKKPILSITMKRKHTVAAPKAKLSALIDEAEKLEYDVPKWKIWARRALFVLGALVTSSIAIAIACCLMTPGVNILTALVMVPTALTAILAFIYLHKPVSVNESSHMTMDGIPINVTGQMTLGASLGALLPMAMAFNPMRKHSTIINPPREIAARNLQAATINKLSSELIKEIKKLNDSTHSDVKKFMLSVVYKTEKMYNAGVSSCFYESQSTKLQKARMILRETAKIVESDNIPKTVDEILCLEVANKVKNRKGNITNAKITYGHILNIQRNCPHFFNQNTKLKTQLIKETTNVNWPVGQLSFG